MAGRSTRSLAGMQSTGALSIDRRALYGWFIPVCAYWVLLTIAWTRSGGPADTFPRPHGLFLAAGVIVPLLNLWVLGAKLRSIPTAIGIGAIVPAVIFSALFRL